MSCSSDSAARLLGGVRDGAPSFLAARHDRTAAVSEGWLTFPLEAALVQGVSLSWGVFVFACINLRWCYLTHIMSRNELPHLSTLALRQRKARLLRTLTFPPDAIHASFLERFLKCGRPNCHCRTDEKHGPFFYLSRCLPKRQMRTLLLKEPSQIRQARHGVEAYQQLLENALGGAVFREGCSLVNWPRKLKEQGDRGSVVSYRGRPGFGKQSACHR